MLNPDTAVRILQRVPSLILRISTDPNDSPEDQLRMTISVGLVNTGVLSLTMWGLLFLWFGQTLAAMFWFAYAAFLLATLIIYAAERDRVYSILAVSHLVAVLVIPAVATLLVGGFVDVGGIAWGILAPVSALVVFGPRPQALGWFGAYAVTVIAGLVLQPYIQPTRPLRPAVESVFLAISVLSVAGYVVGTLYYFVSQRNLLQEKSENLLLNILPAEIAAILKRENRVIADYYDGASVLFADVVDFTWMATRMTPIETVDLLNEVFSHFDTLVETYELEKIKTIGDCYMVAAGVPRPRRDHAQCLTQVALEMQEYVRGRTFQGGRQLSLRIGINSGPVVAGVIGRKKFIYDLWGDAVNTASRMESQGEGGRIQVSRATYELIKDTFLCESRGTIKVKGKGDMEVWHVVGKQREP